MPAASDDLDLLLSLEGDRVPETPPGSPSSSQSRLYGHLSADGSPKRSRASDMPARASDMSAFRETVKDYLESEPTNPTIPHPTKKAERKLGEVHMERFSGIRIRNQLVSPIELSNRFSDVRFVRMSTIRNLLSGDTLSGCWATVGVLAEKGEAKSSSSGKNYCVWKMGNFDETNVSVLLFGDAYKLNCSEMVGTVFALFNSNVRKDTEGHGFSLSLYSVGQILKLGTSADFGICKGKRKDGMPCTMVINKNKGPHCKHHSYKDSQKYVTMRSELKGGNIKMAFRSQPEGVFIVNPQSGQSNRTNSVQKIKVMSVDRLKKVLSTADKLTTNRHSQGIRFLSNITAITEPKQSDPIQKPNKFKANPRKRPAVPSKLPANLASKNEPGIKSKKACQPSVNMIELDVVSSDEER